MNAVVYCMIVHSCNYSYRETLINGYAISIDSINGSDFVRWNRDLPLKAVWIGVYFDRCISFCATDHIQYRGLIVDACVVSETTGDEYSVTPHCRVYGHCHPGAIEMDFKKRSWHQLATANQMMTDDDK